MKHKKNRSVIARYRTKLIIGLAGVRRAYFRRIWGMKIGHQTRLSRKAFLDFTNPSGVHIGDYTIVTPGVRIFTHDFVGARHVDTFIGSCCFIGANSIILPGVRVGDHCIIAAGSVVNKDVPDRSLVAGNPAKVIRSDLKTGYWGMTAKGSPGLSE